MRILYDNPRYDFSFYLDFENMMQYKHRKTIYFPLIVAVFLILITTVLLINNLFGLGLIVALFAVLCFYLFYLQKQSFMKINSDSIQFRSLVKVVNIEWQFMRLVIVESYVYPEKFIPQAGNYMKFKFIYNNDAIIETGISGMLFIQADCVAIEQELYRYCRQYNIKMSKQFFKHAGRNQFSFQHEEFLVGRDD